jgi:hypothetical protein
MTPRERADRAQQLLNDPVFIKAMSDIREQIVAKIEHIAVSDVEAQHDLAISLQLLKQLRLQLSRYSEEIVIDNAVARNATWLQRAKSYMP